MIRNATDSDLQALTQIRQNMPAETVLERLKKQAAHGVEYLVFESESKIVGHVVLRWQGKLTHPDYPDMVDLYVQESQRGKGYGTKLIAECERRAKERGFTKMGLAVNPDLNDPAVKLYTTLGYKHTGDKPYVDGVYDGTKDWCVDMEKDLI